MPRITAALCILFAFALSALVAILTPTICQAQDDAHAAAVAASKAAQADHAALQLEHTDLERVWQGSEAKVRELSAANATLLDDKAWLLEAGRNLDPNFPPDRTTQPPPPLPTESTVGAKLTGPTSTGALYDAQLRKWTLAAGVVYVDGNPAAFSRDVQTLEYFGGGLLRQTAASGRQWTWDDKVKDWVLLVVKPPPLPDPDPVASSEWAGINLSAASYYATHWQFADVMRMAKRESTVGDLVTYRVFVDTNGRFPVGTFTAEFDGGGSVAITRSSTGNGLTIKAKGDVRELRVWAPGYGKGEPRHGQKFHQAYLDSLRAFKKLRFMDQLETNHSTRSTWSQRTSTRVQIEDMVDLCNELDADAWFCIPHMADDDYVRRFAELVKSRLEAGRKIYLEYSNEVWNSQFKQFHWTRDVAGGGDLHKGWADRMRTIFAIWRDVFSDNPARVVRVLAGQAATVYHAKKVAERLGRGGFDAISCAHYIGFNKSVIPADASVDWFFETLRNNLHGKAAGYWAEHGALAALYGVPLVGYEGGQHVTPDGNSSVGWYANWIKAQRDPRMYELYIEGQEAWRKAGGKTWMSFNHCEPIGKWGSWGHLEYQDQPIAEAHKYRALIDYAAKLESSK